MIHLDEKKSEKYQIKQKHLRDAARLKRLLRQGVVEFTYKKLDGSLRKAKGTLKPSLLPETDENDDRRKNTNDDCLIYFDLVRNDYRQFRKENLRDIKEKKE